jgi:hypothetical protein
MFLRNEPDPLSKNPGSWLVTRSDRREAVGEIGRGLIGVSRLAALQRQRRPYLALTSSSTVAGAVQIKRDFSRRFGTQGSGIMFGWLMVLHQVGGAMAAFFAGVIRVDFGSYLQAFILSGILCLVAALLVLFVAGETKTSAQSSTASL